MQFQFHGCQMTVPKTVAVRFRHLALCNIICKARYSSQGVLFRDRPGLVFFVTNEKLDTVTSLGTDATRMDQITPR